MVVRVLVISHSYIEPESQKSILALSADINVMVLVPKNAPVLVFKDYRHVPLDGCQEIIRACTTLRVSSAQYAFLAMRLAPKGFRPDVLVVEYNPWSLVFAQAWLYKALFLRKAILVCLVKKNTYRSYGGVRGKVKDWLADFLAGKVDYFIAASEKASNMLRSRFGGKAYVASVEHHLGVDTELFCPKQRVALGTVENIRKQIVIGYCGRLDEDKGVTELVDAVREVRRSTKIEVALSIIGRGSLDHVVRQVSIDEPWVTVHPPVPHVDVASFLRGLDIFVLPSKPMPDHEEHDAHGLLEALSCGLACIATAVGINGEIIRDGNGILVPPGQSGALIEAVERLVMGSAERERLGRKAREVALRDYSIQAVAHRRSLVLQKLVRA